MVQYWGQTKDYFPATGANIHSEAANWSDVSITDGGLSVVDPRLSIVR